MQLNIETSILLGIVNGDSPTEEAVEMMGVMKDLMTIGMVAQNPSILKRSHQSSRSAQLAASRRDGWRRAGNSAKPSLRCLEERRMRSHTIHDDAT